MISQSNCKFMLTCDNCSTSVTFKKFKSAVNYANTKRYIIKLTENGSYKSICMKCQNEK